MNAQTTLKMNERSLRRMARNGLVAYLYASGEQYDCQITDLNVKGAHLILPARIMLPTLIYLSLNRGAVPRAAHVRWQKGAHLGIEYVR